MGRPSTYSAETVDAILSRVSEGEPLAQVCREPDMPSLSTFRDWVRKVDGLSVRLAHAREDGFDMIAADILGIVDGGHNNPQLAKVRAEIRLKLLAVWDPARYSETKQLRLANHEGGSLRDISESEATARVASILEAVRRRALPPPSEGVESPKD